MKKKASKTFKQFDLYLLLLPTLVYLIVYHYAPMYGVVLSFKDYNPALGIWGSPWVGFEHYLRFFKSHYFIDLLKNTVGISLYSILINMPIPIIFALMLNELRSKKFKKVVQTILYTPHFISTVVIVGLLMSFLTPQKGAICQIAALFGGELPNLMAEADWFSSLYVFSGLWQELGWWTIIYVAVLSGVDQNLHEAARIDGATKLQRIWHINIPWLMPTIVVLFVLSVGGILSVGFEKIYLMQNKLNLDASEVFSTYVYKAGLLEAQYGFSTAVNVFSALINMFLLVLANAAAKRMNQSSLW